MAGELATLHMAEDMVAMYLRHQIAQAGTEISLEQAAARMEYMLTHHPDQPASASQRDKDLLMAVLVDIRLDTAGARQRIADMMEKDT